ISMERQTVYVPVDIGRLVLFSPDEEVQVVDDANVHIGFAKHGVSFLSRCQQKGSIPVVLTGQFLRGINSGTQRDVVQKITGLQSRPATDGPRLADRAVELATIEVVI